MKTALRLSLVALSLAMLLTSRSASAFSVRVHVYLANAIHDELARNVTDSGRPLVRLMQPDSADPAWVQLADIDARAILLNPEFFRGGAIGPDNTVMTGLTDPSHAWAFRPFHQCQALVGEAAAEEQRQRDAGVAEEELDLSERAYALGCFLHGISDNAAHHVVNFLAGETFTFYPKESASADGLQWSMLNVARHIVVETSFEKSLLEQDAAFTGEQRYRAGVMTEPVDDAALEHRIAIDLVRRVYFDNENEEWTGLWSFFADELVLAKTLRLRLELGLSPMGGIQNALLGAEDEAWDDDTKVVNAYVDFLANGYNGVSFTPADYIIFLPELTRDIKLFYTIVNEQGRWLAQNITSLRPITKAMLNNAFAPRNAAGEVDWENGTEPSRFEGVMEIKFAELDSFVVKYIESVENLSNLNITVGLLNSTSEQRREAIKPLSDAVSVVTTINYQILFSDNVIQILSEVSDVIAVLDGLFALITEKVEEYILGQIRDHLEALKGAFDPLKAQAEVYMHELERQAVSQLGLELDGGVFSTYLDSVLYMNAYNSVVGVISNRDVAVANTSGLFAGPVSFDASYQLEYNQLALCGDLRAVFYPCGANASDMLQGNYRTCQPLTDVLNPAVECHAQSATAFASMPTTADCAPTELDEFLDGMAPDQGSYTLAFPPSSQHLAGEPPACWIEGLAIVNDGAPEGVPPGTGGPGAEDDEGGSEAGCACSTPAGTSDGPAAWLALLALGLLRRRRSTGPSRHLTRLAWTAALAPFVVTCTDPHQGEDDDGAASATTGAGGAQAATVTVGIGGSTSSNGSGGVREVSIGSGGEVGCVDLGPQEPNDTEATAVELPEPNIDDCDESGSMLLGTIAGADDEDWFFFTGMDELCTVDPSRTVAADEDGLRVCKFLSCLSGDTEFTCPAGTTDATSPDGLAGCCGGTEFVIDDLNCTFTIDDDAVVYIRIDHPGATATTCNGYNLSYHY